MKTVKVDRWERQIEIKVPESAQILESETKVELVSDPVEGIRKALKNPLGMEPISKLVNKGSKIAVVGDDPMKVSPIGLTISPILEELYKAGVKGDNIVLVSANGCHKRGILTDFIDYRAMGYGLLPGMGRPWIPKDIFDRFWPSRVIRHDASHPEGLVNMGYSKLGDLVEVNKILADYDLVIYTGGIYPMDWGGYGGTGVVNGLGSARSIASHHISSVSAHQDSCHGDPRTHFYRKHKDAVMERVEEYVGRKVFYIEGVLNGSRQWTHFSAGHFKETQEPTWKAADQDRLFEVEQADVVVAGLPKWVRYDTSDNPVIDFAAAAAIVRSWVGKPLLREGGVIILISTCNGHIDSDGLPSCTEVLDLYGKMGNASRLEEKYLDEFLVREDYLKKYSYGYGSHPTHPFWLFAQSQYVHDHVGKLIIATAENPEAVRKIGGTWTEDFDQAFKMAEKVVGRNPRVLVLPAYFTKPPIKFAVK